MPFLKISDPAKRDAKVKEYLDLKNRIRDNFRRERTGEMEMQSDLTKFFKPITETQKATAREITEELKPIKEGIENLPNAITFPSFPSIKATSEPTEIQDVQYIDDLARQYLMIFTTKENLTDKTFGIYSKGNKFYIGDRNVKINGNDIIVLDNDENVDKKHIKEHLDYGNYLCFKNQMRKSLFVVIWRIMRICCIKLILYIRIMIQIRIVLKVIIKEIAG